jgi:hypothetical protein
MWFFTKKWFATAAKSKKGEKKNSLNDTILSIG